MKYFFYLPQGEFEVPAPDRIATDKDTKFLVYHGPLALYKSFYTNNLCLLPVGSADVPDTQYGCENDEYNLVTIKNKSEAVAYCNYINKTTGRQSGFKLRIFQKK